MGCIPTLGIVHLSSDLLVARKRLPAWGPVYFVLIERSINKKSRLRQITVTRRLFLPAVSGKTTSRKQRRRETLAAFLHRSQPRFLPSSAWYNSLSPRIPTTLLLSCSTSLWPVW